MRCLRKFQWIKLFRDNLPEGKGILGFWAKLAACAAYRNGTSFYAEKGKASKNILDGIDEFRKIKLRNARLRLIAWQTEFNREFFFC